MAVLITCFNRKEKTLSCLDALFKNHLQLDHKLEVFLVDDGSSDGTSQAVQDRFPKVNLIRGDGSLFWNGGMRVAFAAALGRGFDYYLWLNDDTMLRSDAVSRLLETAAVLGESKPVIVVGSTMDAKTGMLTYGGVVRVSRFRPITYRLVEPNDRPQRCDSMTGNIVVIPSKVAQAVGNLDPAFEHAMGDTDYALRAYKLGYEVWVGSGIFGACSHNSLSGTYLDASQPLTRRWQQMMGRKGLPWKPWLVLTRRHTGPLWLIYFTWPYIRLIVGGICHR